MVDADADDGFGDVGLRSLIHFDILQAGKTTLPFTSLPQLVSMPKAISATSFLSCTS